MIRSTRLLQEYYIGGIGNLFNSQVVASGLDSVQDHSSHDLKPKASTLTFRSRLLRKEGERRVLCKCSSFTAILQGFYTVMVVLFLLLGMKSIFLLQPLAFDMQIFSLFLAHSLPWEPKFFSQVDSLTPLTDCHMVLGLQGKSTSKTYDTPMQSIQHQRPKWTKHNNKGKQYSKLEIERVKNNPEKKGKKMEGNSKNHLEGGSIHVVFVS